MVKPQAIASSGHPLVSETALSIIQKGGNAFDAAISAGFVSSVVEPALTSLGGGGFLLAGTADGRTRLFDFFSDTPGKGLQQQILTPHFFPVTVKFAGSHQDFNVGMGSVAVPGTLKGFLHVHSCIGRLPLKEIVHPAITAAKKGVKLLEKQSHFLHLLEPILTMTDEGKKLYSPDGRSLGYGDIMKNNDIALFLRHLAEKGTTFYEGKHAKRIAEDMHNGKGLLTSNDLASYQVAERAPLRSSYKNLTLVTNPSPSFGGTFICLALEELENYSLSSCNPTSSDYIHAHGKVMLDVEKKRADFHAQSSDTYRFNRGTTHLSICDSEGNVASMTNSNGEGSGYIIPGTGIMLNNMMGEDDLHPAGFHAGLPCVRVSSMMSPSLLVDGDKIKLVIGSGGSKRIRTAITQVISLVIDCGLDIQEAIDFPRFHWDGDVFQIEPGFPEQAIKTLAKLGPVNVWSEKNVYFGGVHAVMPGGKGGCDHRRGGAVRALFNETIVSM